MNRRRNSRKSPPPLRLQRTIGATAPRVFAAWTEAHELSTWFTRRARVDVRAGGHYTNADGDTGTYLRVDSPRALRFTWDNAKHCPGTVVDLRLAPAGRGRTRLVLEHRGLEGARHVADMRGGWSWALDSLRSYLETGVPIRHEDWLAARTGRKR
jgi:uncharacterized protein YndB with AHSA1/START domain